MNFTKKMVKIFWNPSFKFKTLDEILVAVLAVAINQDLPPQLLNKLVYFHLQNVDHLIKGLKIENSDGINIKKEANTILANITWPDEIEIKVSNNDLEIIFHWVNCTFNEEGEEPEDVEEDEEELNDLDATQVISHMEEWRKKEQKKYTTKKAFWDAYNTELFNFINTL